MIKYLSHDAIDFVQNGKKAFVTIFIRHDELAKSINSFIDAQTRYTKDSSDALYSSATELGNLVSDKNFVQEMVQSYGLDRWFMAKSK